MTIVNDTQIEVYNQLIQVQKCIEALKDIYVNIPEDDNYSSVLSIIGDRLDFEFNSLFKLVI